MEGGWESHNFILSAMWELIFVVGKWNRTSAEALQRKETRQGPGALPPLTWFDHSLQTLLVPYASPVWHSNCDRQIKLSVERE